MEKLSFDQWNKAPTATIINYIIDHFHHHLKIQLPQIKLLFEKELDSNGSSDIIAASYLFSEFALHMNFHLQQEETIVFPFLLSVETNTTSDSLRTVGPLIAAMEKDHHEDLFFISQMKQRTHHFQPAPLASDNLKLLFKYLEELIQELELHIEMEDNLVFKRFKNEAMP